MKKLIRWVEKYFSGIQSSKGEINRVPFRNYTQKQVIRKRKGFQTHCMIGTTGYSLKDERRFSLAFLNNILGGPMMNSRLALALKEKNGIAYNVESAYMPFSDTGIFSIYFGTSPALLDKAVGITLRELKKLREEKLGTVQLQTAKKVILGQMALAQESNLNQMLAIGKSWLVMNHYLGFDEISRIIEYLSAEKIRETANEIFAAESLSTLIFKS